MFFLVDKHVIVTSKKVMYSSLCHTEGLKRINRFYAYYLYLIGYDFYMIVRNPRDRIISFFKNKFRATDNPNQVCQRLFYPYLKGMTNREKLENTSINHFVSVLPKAYEKDGHLFPQYRNMGLYIKSIQVFIPFNFKKITVIKMESDIPFLEKKIGLCFAHKNKTKNVATEQLNAFSVAIIESIYQTDYELFSYNRGAKRPFDIHTVAFVWVLFFVLFIF